jgi:hypothetical protein
MKVYIRGNIKRFFDSDKWFKPLYEWRKDGSIIMLWGPWRGEDLVKKWHHNRESVESFFDNILDSEEAPIKLVIHTKEVYDYLCLECERK